jgi:hypothetical protein
MIKPHEFVFYVICQIFIKVMLRLLVLNWFDTQKNIILYNQEKCYSRKGNCSSTY